MNHVSDGRPGPDIAELGAETTAASSLDVRAAPWHLGIAGGFVLLLVLGFLIRVALWPQAGLVGDVDVFVQWVHGLATRGFGHAYDQQLSFPAVMAWIWGALAAVQPAFARAPDATDPAILALMKAPASLADLGIAAAVGWWFRDSPRLALAAAAAILLWPVTWYVSALWGQYESLYVLPALLAVLAARAHRPGWAAALLAIALMTKPQALPFAVPFAAWFLATEGWRGALKAATIAGAVALVLWLPFLAAGGPIAYLRNLGAYQNDMFDFLSLRAWNPWWLVQELFGGGNFISDQTAVVGPLTYRMIGLAAAAGLVALVFVSVYRQPTPERLAMGLAAVTLGAFIGLTTMHERYSYPAIVFLMLCWPNRNVVAAWVALAVALMLNLVYAAPPPGLALPAYALVGIVGSVAITAVAVAALRWTWQEGNPGGAVR